MKMSTPYVKLETPIDETALVCRGCLAESGEMKNMIEWGLQDDFLALTNVPVKAEGISELLCTSCEETLMICKSFKAQCQQSNSILQDTAKKKLLHKTKFDERAEATSCLLFKDFLQKKSVHKAELDDTINTTSCSLTNDKLIIKITAPEAHSKVYLTCPHHCRVTFIKKKDLLIHLKKKHQTDKDILIELQYYCSYVDCPYHFSSGKEKYFSGRKFLNQHYNKVHKSKIFHCDDCGASFPISSDFNRHLRTCNMTFSCEICNVQYNSNEKLLVHLMRKHPELHKQYKSERKAEKRKLKTDPECKKAKTEINDYIFCDSPKRSFATQTLRPEDNIKNDVTLLSWQSTPGKSDYETKTDEISTQTVFEDLLSLKSQTSEDESIFFSETVSLSDIHTQTFPLEFGLSRSNKETITSETQSPDLSIKETQTCCCHYDSPKMNFRLFDSVSSSPIPTNLTSTETQTADMSNPVKNDVFLSFNSTETQTYFDSELNKDDL